MNLPHFRPPVGPLALALGLCATGPADLHATPAQEDVPVNAFSAARYGPPALAPARPVPRLHPAAELERLEDLLDRPARDDVADLRRAAFLAMTLALAAEGAGDEGERLAWVRRAEDHARRAFALAPGSPDARYLVAASMGLRAIHEPVRERVRMAGVIRAHADTILLADPGHPGALHLVGQLNAAAMRLNPIVRFIARTTLGGDVLGDASWATAEAAFRGAISGEPESPAHRWELARLLVDTDRQAEARAELEEILRLPGDGALAAHYQAKAGALLRTLP